MSEPMSVQVEIWPVAADGTGVWLVVPEAIRSGPVAQDSDPHFEVENALYRAGIESTLLIHSTSWRAEGPHAVLTYIVVVDARYEPVPTWWPQALPIGQALLTAVGPLPAVAANDAPLPHHAAVLLHAIRHLAFLQRYDDVACAALPLAWLVHLGVLRPSLAGLYREAS